MTERVVGGQVCAGGGADAARRGAREEDLPQRCCLRGGLAAGQAELFQHDRLQDWQVYPGQVTSLHIPPPSDPLLRSNHKAF